MLVAKEAMTACTIAGNVVDVGHWIALLFQATHLTLTFVTDETVNDRRKVLRLMHLSTHSRNASVLEQRRMHIFLFGRAI